MAGSTSLDMDDLVKVLEGLPIRYGDMRLLKGSLLEMALREDSFEASEERWDMVVCRVIDQGYGIASTYSPDMDRVREISRLAWREARRFKEALNLSPIEVERGEVEHPLEKVLGVEDAALLLRDLRGEIEERLKGIYSRSELIITHQYIDSTLATSEGARIREGRPLTDITLYILAKDRRQGYASKILGGMGGYEVLDSQPWEEDLDGLVKRVKASTSTLQSLRAGRYKVILDCEAAGALAHEVAHLLEADIHQSHLFQGLDLSEDLAVIDDPTIPGGYGSFHWDDEGVLGRRKVLLSQEGVSLLHTRLTARPGDLPGNARGVTHRPRPLMSNIFLKPSDWRVEELFQETRRGIYVEGVVRVESDARDGRIEIIPEITYLLEDGEVKKPLKGVRLMGGMGDLQRIDGIGRKASLRPNLEKGHPISEGGPSIRIDGILCLGLG